jgi:1-deoxy-D-xylulose-5-phosphate synthase
MMESIPLTTPLTPLLDRINGVADLRHLQSSQLPVLAAELRQFLLYCVGQTGGHLGAGLGVVELTLVLHYLFDTPNDRLLWDVGHQAYPHKIITGRRQAMLTMRQQGGLAPFPKLGESEFDAFGAGHASISISALLGMSLASEQAQRQHIAVIGDGALTGGIAYEALHHAAHCQADILVIVNDNQMSISANVGGLARFFGNHDPTANVGQWFHSLGFHYQGPIDGHDIPCLMQHLTRLAAIKGPRLLHIHTIKGKGYGPAERDAVGYHAIDKINPIDAPSSIVQGRTYSQVFGDWMLAKASADPRLLAITPAMVNGSGLEAFGQHYPERLFDVAIAEQHALTLAAGMACAGAKPVVAIYSTFLQRAYDQLIHDIALQQLDVLVAIDRAGLVGEDGPTHAGAYDLAYLRCIPDLVVMTPGSATETEAMLEFAYHYAGPVCVRYPRGPAVSGSHLATEMQLGRSRIMRQGQGLALLNFGALLPVAIEIAEQLDATLVDMRFVKPLDHDRLAQLVKQHRLLVSLEDHVVQGGAGSAVAQSLQQQDLSCPLLMLGHADRFVAHASRAQMLAVSGLDQAGIQRQIDVAWQTHTGGPLPRDVS